MLARCSFATLVIMSFSATLITLSGCGGGATEEQSAAAPAVDPRYASAEALVAEYNLIVGDGRGIDARLLVGLFYAENEIQRRMIGVLGTMVPVFDLDRAMWRRFGTGLAAEGSGGLTDQLTTARLAEQTGDRATAVYPEPDGSEGTLMLVKIGDRWWLSGFTFEHDPTFEGEADIAEMEEMSEALAPIAGGLVARIEAGEFEGVEEARSAVMLAVFQRMAEKDRQQPGMSGG